MPWCPWEIPFSKCFTLGKECDQGLIYQCSYLPIRVNGAENGKEPGQAGAGVWRLWWHQLGSENVGRTERKDDPAGGQPLCTMYNSLLMNGEES